MFKVRDKNKLTKAMISSGRYRFMLKPESDLYAASKNMISIGKINLKIFAYESRAWNKSGSIPKRMSLKKLMKHPIDMVGATAISKDILLSKYTGANLRVSIDGTSINPARRRNLTRSAARSKYNRLSEWFILMA